MWSAVYRNCSESDRILHMLKQSAGVGQTRCRSGSCQLRSNSVLSGPTSVGITRLTGPRSRTFDRIRPECRSWPRLPQLWPRTRPYLVTFQRAGPRRLGFTISQEGGIFPSPAPPTRARPLTPCPPPTLRPPSPSAPPSYVHLCAMPIRGQSIRRRCGSIWRRSTVDSRSIRGRSGLDPWSTRDRLFIVPLSFQGRSVVVDDSGRSGFI